MILTIPMDTVKSGEVRRNKPMISGTLLGTRNSFEICLKIYLEIYHFEILLRIFPKILSKIFPWIPPGSPSWIFIAIPSLKSFIVSHRSLPTISLGVLS